MPGRRSRTGIILKNKVSEDIFPAYFFLCPENAAKHTFLLVSASAVSSGKYIPPFFDKNIDFL